MAGQNGQNGHRHNGSGDPGAPKRPKGGRIYTWSKDEWLKHYEETRGVDTACAKVGIGVSTAYRRRDLDPEFKAAWLGVKAVHREQYKRSVATRAIEGTLRPIFKEVPVRTDPNNPASAKLRDADGDVVMKWQAVGAERVYETALTIWWGKTNMPEELSDPAVMRRSMRDGEDMALQAEADAALRKLSDEGLAAYAKFLDEYKTLEQMEEGLGE